jgi:lipopolysaccharide transport system permease protein
LWFYATPIVYPITLVPENLRSFYFLNPMVGVIQAYRNIMLEGTPPSSEFLLSAIIAVIILGIGYWLFKRLEYQFADII